MAKILVYNNNSNRMEIYYRDLNRKIELIEQKDEEYKKRVKEKLKKF